MPKAKFKKLHKNIVLSYHRLVSRGGVICRQFSSSDEAVACGGNYIYFTVKDNEKFPTGAGRFLIENGLCVSSDDGLFDFTPQTFKAVDREKFEAFKSQYEALINA
ncbi:UNVERIFIED_ORG: hypothetical protein J2W66_002905 [Agrobacterium larrymoorei]|nr:hypothetical protein [Agrobacterium larrymoorei]